MGLLTFLFGCSNSLALKEGALYSVNDGEGSYRIAKILVVDPEVVHVRLYKNKWKRRPTRIDVSALSLGSVHDSDGFGMGHLPLSREAFLAWQPSFLEAGKAAKDELDGYEMWKEANGGHFGK